MDIEELCYSKPCQSDESHPFLERRFLFFCFVFAVLSFVEFLQYVFTIPGVKLFLSSKLSQNPIEKFFGQQRQRGSSNDNPNVDQFLKNTQAIRVINTTRSNIRRNFRGTNKAETLHQQQKWIAGKENKPLPKRRNRKKSSKAN